MPYAYFDSFCKMFSKYDNMWDGRLGELNVVKHRIYLTPEVNQTLQRPFRTGPAWRKFISDEVQSLLDIGIIEPVQT